MDQSKDIPIFDGSGNVFQDLGFPDPEIHLLKARLVHVISRLIKSKGLSQFQASQLMGIDPTQLSDLLKGNFRDYTIDGILRLFLHLGAKMRIMTQTDSKKTSNSRATSIAEDQESELFSFSLIREEKAFQERIKELNVP